MGVPSVAGAFFAATMIALGIWGFIKGDFTPVWEPVPKGVPAREALVYLCAFISLACGLGLFRKRVAALAARVLFFFLLLWMLGWRVPDILRAPRVEASWSGCAETAVMVAGAWVLYAWLAADWDRQRLAVATGDRGLRLARGLYGFALIPFGLAHFVYLPATVVLVPRWLPAHAAWAYFTGGAFLAAGLGILGGICARLAVALSAVQLALFTILVWVPIVAAGSKNPFQWSETILSWALTIGAWVVADSYRGRVERAVPNALNRRDPVGTEQSP